MAQVSAPLVAPGEPLCHHEGALGARTPEIRILGWRTPWITLEVAPPDVLTQTLRELAAPFLGILSPCCSRHGDGSSAPGVPSQDMESLQERDRDRLEGK